MTRIESIPFDRREGTIWLDGELVEWKTARVHVLTHGLHYASCVFEGERVYAGQVFKLREHTDRLFRSAALLDFALPYSKEMIEAATRRVIEENGIVDGYVRPAAWRGSEMMSTSARSSRAHVAIACWRWPNYYAPAARSDGITMQTAAWRRPPPTSNPHEAKASAQYMIATLSKHQAENNGYQDALMLDWRGRVAEASSANIFLVKGSVIHTPVPDCFLDGITRRTVIALARQRGYEVIERAIWPSELAGFDECFITGTAIEVCPVRQIDEHTFSPAAICRDMVDAYAAAVRAKSSPQQG